MQSETERDIFVLVLQYAASIVMDMQVRAWHGLEAGSVRGVSSILFHLGRMVTRPCAVTIPASNCPPGVPKDVMSVMVRE